MSRSEARVTPKDAISSRHYFQHERGMPSIWKVGNDILYSIRNDTQNEQDVLFHHKWQFNRGEVGAFTKTRERKLAKDSDHTMVGSSMPLRL